MGEESYKENDIREFINELNKSLKTEKIYVDTFDDEGSLDLDNDVNIVIYCNRDEGYTLSVYDIDENIKAKRPISILHFSAEEEFMNAIDKLYQYDMEKYDYNYYRGYHDFMHNKNYLKIGNEEQYDNYKPERKYIEVIINSKKLKIRDRGYWLISRYFHEDKEDDEMFMSEINDVLNYGRCRILIIQLFLKYICEYAKFEYLDNSKIIMRINDLNFEIPIKQKKR